MAEQNECAGDVVEDDVDNQLYKPPAEKTLKEIQELDKEDASLEKYKAMLLGQSTDALPRPDDKRKVIVEKMVFCSEGRPEIEMDLTVPNKNLSFAVKEGSKYKLRILFIVQRDLVSGLLFKRKVLRGPVTVESDKFMVGSYAPKGEHHVYTTEYDELPSGMLARGKYKVEGTFTDDDKNIYLQWSFGIEIKKDWE